MLIYIFFGYYLAFFYLFSKSCKWEKSGQYRWW